jgi:hypothetical protein
MIIIMINDENTVNNDDAISHDNNTIDKDENNND